MGAVLESNVYLIATDALWLVPFMSREVVCTRKGARERVWPQFHQRMTFLFQPAVNLPLEASLFAEGDCFSGGSWFPSFPLLYNGERPAA